MCQLGENDKLNEGIIGSYEFVTRPQLKEMGTFQEFLQEAVK